MFRDLQDASVYEESSVIQRLREDLRICQTESRYGQRHASVAAIELIE